jgi:hypothetical protein
MELGAAQTLFENGDADTIFVAPERIYESSLQDRKLHYMNKMHFNLNFKPDGATVTSLNALASLTEKHAQDFLDPAIERISFYDENRIDGKRYIVVTPDTSDKLTGRYVLPSLSPFGQKRRAMIEKTKNSLLRTSNDPELAPTVFLSIGRSGFKDEKGRERWGDNSRLFCSKPLRGPLYELDESFESSPGRQRATVPMQLLQDELAEMEDSIIPGHRLSVVSRAVIDALDPPDHPPYPNTTREIWDHARKQYPTSLLHMYN